MAQKETFEIGLKDNLSAGVKNAGKNVDGLRNKIQGIDSTVKKIGGALGALFVVDKIVDFTKGVANLGIKMEQTKTTFRTFTGDATKAEQVIGNLTQFSNVTPFDSEQVLQAGKSLLAFGETSENLVPTLGAIGDIAAGTGKDFNELTTIYGKAKVAGKLYAEDINQLVEAGVPIIGEFAKQMGVTEGEVKKLASQGKISFSNLQNAFVDLTGEGGLFFNLMKDQSATVGGRISTLVGKIQLIGASMGEALLPAIGFLTDLAIKVADNIDTVILFTKMIGALSLGVGAYMAVTKAAAIGTAIWTKAQALLNVVMTMNPIGLVIAAIVALVAAIAIAWQESETFRGVVMGVWESLKAIGDIIWQYVQPTFQAFDKIFRSIFSGDFSGFIEGLKNLGKQIIRFVIEPFRPLMLMFDKIAGTNINDSVSKVFGKGIVESIGEKVPDAFKKGMKEGVADFQKEQEGKGSNETVFDRLKKTPLGAGGGAGSANGLAKNLKSGLSTIKASAPKTFNVNIGKLVENLTFESRNNTADTMKLKEEIKKVFLEAVNDVQLGAT